MAVKKNTNSGGYSDEALLALKRGTYGKETNRNARYSTSQDQLRQVKELPTLKPSATVKAEKSITSKPKAQDNYVVHRDKYDELMQDSGLANDIMKLATINYSNANQDATVSQEWADTFGAKAITGGLTKTDYIESLKKKYGLSSRELNDMALTFHSDANKKEVEDYARDLENIGKNHAVLGSLGSFVGTLGSGVEGLYNTVVGGITGDDRYLSNMFSTTKNSPRQGVKENIKSDLGKGVYDVGMGIGDMAVGTAAGSAPAILAGNTANEAQASARERGSSVRRASAYAAGAGALDYITNTIGLDKAKKMAISSIKGAGLKKFIGQNFMAGLGEAGENVIQDIGQSFLDAIINGENAELNQSFQNKVASGMSKDEAFSETAKEYASQLAMSGGLGFGMGSAMQAGASALPALRGMNRSKSDVPNIDPEIQNAIETSEAAQAEIQNLQNQLPKVEAQSAPKITLTPEESARLQQSKPVEKAKPVEVDPNDVIYHAGTLSRLNKADSAGKMEGMRNTGYYGTGHYFVDGAHKGEIGKNTSYGNKPYSSVDISKYNNLFKADTDAKASKLHDFSQKMMRYINGYNDRYFTDSEGIVPEDLKEYMDDMYSNYKNLFGDKAMSQEEFETRLNDFRNNYDFNAEDRGDSAFTTFMKEHGYNGVDTRGTRSADTERGVVIYDLDEDSVLQSNVTDTDVKNGLMNTRVRNGQPVFDVATDEKIQKSLNNYAKKQQIKQEYNRLYNEANLRQIESDIQSTKERIQNLEENVIPYEENMLEGGEEFQKEVDRTFREFKRFDPDVTREDIESLLRNNELDRNEDLENSRKELNNLKQELSEMQTAYDNELKASEEAYRQAKDYVNGTNAPKEYLNEEKNIFKTPDNIKEIATSNRTEVKNMEPVATVKTGMFKDGEGDIPQKVANYWAKWGNKAHNDVLGDVTLTKKTAKSSLAHNKLTRRKVDTYAVVPDVIEKGKVIDYQPSWKGRDYDTAIIVAPTVIENENGVGEEYITGVIVRRNKHSQKFYTHDAVSVKENESSLETRETSSDIPTEGEGSLSVYSILRKIADDKLMLANEVPTVKPTEPQAPTEAPKVPEVTNVPPQTPPTDIGTTPANGEEKIRSFSERGSKDKSLPDEVRKELKEDTYSVVRNADVEARTDELFDGNDLIQTRSNLEQAIKNHDPVAAPLSYRLAKAYVDAKQYDAANDVIEAVSAELTRSGQFTQAAKLAMMQNDPMAALRAYKRDISNLNEWGKKKYGKKWTKLELSKEDIDAFNNVAKGDKEALNNVVSQLNTKFGRQVPATLWDKLVAASKTSMLLNLRTQGRNIISNAAMLPVRSLSDRVSAVGQNIAHLINPNVKVTQSVTGGTSEQKDIAKQVFENLRESILGENKMKDSTKSDILSNRQIFNDDFIGRFIDKQTNGGLQRLNEKLGGNANKSTMETLSNFTYWLMGDFGDTPFVRKNFVNRLASYMKAQGINNIDDIPDDAIAIATEEALKATFKDDNAFSNALAGIKKKSGKFGEIALPFVKTPANLAMRGIDYSPAGLINTFRKIRSGADANKVIDELAKNLTGTAMIFLGYKLREKGILSGNYSDDKDEKAWQKQQGMLENAVHVGDNYYTFDWAQPTSTPLIIGSVLFDATNNSDEENNGLLKAINSGKDAAVAVGNSWISTSPLQSLSDIMGGGEYNNDGGVAGNVLNEVIEFPQRFIPAQLGAAARTIDPVIRDTYSNDSTLTGTLGNQARALQSRIPQLSKRLPASYDTWGNERTRSDTKGEAFFAQNINPGQLGNKNETPLDAEITRIYNATGNKDVFPLSAARSLNLGNDGNIKLTNKQHSDYQKMLGQQSYKFADAIMNNDDYKSLSDDEKTKALKEAYDFSNALAKEKLFNHATDDGLKKIKEAFEKDGEKGVANFLMEKAKADKLGLDIDTYQKKQAEYTGGAEQYAEDKQKADALGITVEQYNKNQNYQGGIEQYAQDYKTVKAINEKYGTNYNIESYNKYGSGLEQRAQDAQNAKQYGFVDKDGNANTDSYEKAVEIVGTDPQALSSYKEYKSHDYTKMRQKVPALIDNNAFTAEQKGMLVTGKTDPSKIDGKIATGAYEKGGWEGVWYYYMLKDYADANENGRLDKKEKASLRSFMESDSSYVTQIPDDVYYYLGNSIKDW